MNELVDYDRGRGRLVAGCDEAGRGCLAGPITAAAVLFDYGALTEQQLDELLLLNDSKKLTQKRREVLWPVVMRLALRVSLISRSAPTIDRDGLHRTNLAVNHAALMALDAPAGTVLLCDGFPLPEVRGVAPERLIRGDGTSAAIAAASVIAKVSRDRHVRQHLARRHPGYGFEDHCGYGTKAHWLALGELGPSAQHRLSFKGVGAPR